MRRGWRGRGRGGCTAGGASDRLWLGGWASEASDIVCGCGKGLALAVEAALHHACTGAAGQRDRGRTEHGRTQQNAREGRAAGWYGVFAT